MQLIQIVSENNQEYQAFVQSKGIFLQDFNWGDFHAGFKKVYRFAVIDGDEILAAIQMFEHKAFRLSYLYAPYGPVLKGADSAVLRFLLAEIKKRFPKKMFLRIEPQQIFDFFKIGLDKSITLNPHKTLILDLKKSEQDLLAAMHPKTRYNIKVAERNGVKVKIFEDPESISADLFKPIFETSARARIRAYSPQYYLDLIKAFSNPDQPIRARVFSAWHGDDLLATNVLIFYQDNVAYLFGGSSDLKRNMMAPYLLHWQAIQKSKQQGYAKYDFWGVEEDPKHAWAGISRFKFGFGGQIKIYGGTMDFIIRPAWYNVYRYFRTLNRLVR